MEYIAALYVQLLSKLMKRFPLTSLVLSLIALLSCMVHPSIAQEKSGGKIHGYAFGDYYFMVGADTLPKRGAAQYSSTPKNDHGFLLRRVYLGYDYTFNESFSSQVLLEGNDKTLDGSGRYGFIIKTAFVEWKEIIPMGNLLLGLIPTPTWNLTTEKVWNYRAVEKTITDFRGLGNGSDIGVALRGKFDTEGAVSYALMFANGNGQKPENDKHKKYHAALTAKPIDHFVLEGYIDHETANDDRSKTMLKGFAAYQSTAFTVGVEVFQMTQKKFGANNTDLTPFGVSVFAWAPIPSIDDVNAFARFDMYDPDSKTSTSGIKENFLTLGVDYMPIKNVHVMPNLWMNTYAQKDGNRTAPNSDVAGRITFWFVYK